MENLTKENFWNEMMEKYPEQMKKFCDWIDDYKASVNWESLFGTHKTTDGGRIVCSYSAPKFHDLPFAMQLGIWAEYMGVILTVEETKKGIELYLSSNEEGTA